MKYLSSFVLFFLSLSLIGQIDHVGRFELEHDTDVRDYVIIPNQDKGVLFVTPRIQGSNRLYPVELRYLGSNLELIWEETVDVERRYNLMGYHANANMSYLLFQNRTNSNSTKIIKINTDTKEVTQLEPKTIADLVLTEFEVIQNTAILGGYYQERPAVFAYDMESDKVRTLSNVYQRNSELIEIRVNADSVTFNVIASTLTDRKDRTFLVNTYDYGGNAIRGYQLQIPDDYQLLTGVSSSIKDKEQLIVGMFSIDAGNYPTGIFVNHVDRTGVQQMNFYNFGQFDSFLNHLGKRKDKLQSKALAAVDSRKVWRFKTDALFRELLEEKNQVVFAGEFYRPWTMSTVNYQRLRNTTRGVDNFNAIRNPNLVQGSRMAGNDMNFNPDLEEVSFTHAFALGLDFQGNILWDASMDIKETIESGLEFLGDFLYHDQEAFYAYYNDELLIGTHLNNANDTSQYVQPLTLLGEADELRYERDDFRGLVKWFGNRYLVHGIQHVRDQELRKVFFINALTIGTEIPTTVPEK